MPLVDSTTKVRQCSYSALTLSELVEDSTWSGASSYLAPTFTKLVPDSTWTGATDRLPYYGASSTQHLEQYKKVVGRWRHSQHDIQLRLPEFIFVLVEDSTSAGAIDRLIVL